MSATPNTLFGIVLINLSKDFLNILYGSELRISKLNFYYTVMGQYSGADVLLIVSTACAKWCQFSRYHGKAVSITIGGITT